MAQMDNCSVRIQVLAYVNRVLEVDSDVDHDTFTLEQVEANPVRCPDPVAAELMYTGDSSASKLSYTDIANLRSFNPCNSSVQQIAALHRSLSLQRVSS